MRHRRSSPRIARTKESRKDVSEFALAEASRNLDCATDDVTQISDSEIDCVISCHAFEHIDPEQSHSPNVIAF